MTRPGRATIAVAFVIGALFVHPIAGVVLAALFAARRRWPQRAWVLHYAVPAAIGAAALQVLAFQTHFHYAPGGRWPEHFAFAHVSALFAVVLLGLLAVPERRRDRSSKPTRSRSNA
jgi:hypothetical protein